jgi:hypothetical protein
MDLLLGIIGLLYIAFKMMIALLAIGLVLWFLIEFAGAIFKVFFYGCVTVLSLIGLTWLFF